MKKKDLKLFEPFFNQNGHLSIVYKMETNKLYIMNYNGSFYSLIAGNNATVNYEKANISIHDFFHKFPKKHLQFEKKDLFEHAFKEYLENSSSIIHSEQKEENRVLLLII